MEQSKIASANTLFDREPDISYLEEWAKLLAKPLEKVEDAKETSMVVFRLSNEWFSLPTLLFSEISIPHLINPIPCQKDSLVLGIVNLRGQLLVCFSMHKLLGIKEEKTNKLKHYKIDFHYPRLGAISDENMFLTFPIDEVDGIYSIDLSQMSNIPITIANSQENYLKGAIKWNEKKIYIINEEILFQNLRSKIL